MRALSFARRPVIGSVLATAVCAALALLIAVRPWSTPVGVAAGNAVGAAAGHAVGAAAGAAVAVAAASAAGPAVATGGGASVAPRPAAPSRTLSPLQLAGQRVIYSYRGLTPPARLVAAIRAGEAAGVIFFSDNISSRAQIRRVVARLQRDARHSPVKLPLLMMTDQEGGAVRRLTGAPDRSERQIGDSPGAAGAAARAGRGAGLNLQGVGMNVNLAPVLDVYRNAGNFIDQFGRSYSSDPNTVATLGAGFIRAQQATGVATTAKHFPGLGAATASQDTDLSPVTLTVSLGALRAIDELPYEGAITAGVRLVMVSWARYPALDASLPAGLSPTIVQSELGGRLGFGGVTITDAIRAGALRAYGSTAHRAVLAARAGVDLILCASQFANQGSPNVGAAAVSALAGALSDGQLARAGFVAAVRRVMGLRRSP